MKDTGLCGARRRRGWRSPEANWEWSAFSTLACSSPCSGESGKGNCPRTNYGGFWVGFPTQVQEEKQTSVSLDGSVARPVRGWLQPSLGRKPGHACLCVLLFMFFLVISCFLGKFSVKAPSRTWLIPGKRFICTWVRKPECSRGRTGVLGKSQGNSGQLPRPLSPAISAAPHPSCSLPHAQGSWGSSESKPQTFFHPAKASAHPPGEAALGAATRLPSQGSSGVKAELLAPAKLGGAGQGPREA